MLVMAVLGGLTVGTSALGIGKALTGTTKSDFTVPEIKGVETSAETPTILPTNAEPNTITNNNPTIKTKAILPTPTLTLIPTLIPTSVPDSRCLITLFGSQYDVTTLRSTHSGGDIFKCGTDMTTTYTNQHGTNLSRMTKYLVTTSNNSNSNSNSKNTNSAPTATPTKTTSNDSVKKVEKYEDDDDHDIWSKLRRENEDDKEETEHELIRM